MENLCIAAARLAVSPTYFDSLLAKAGIRPVDNLPVRYREADLLKLTLPADERLPVSRTLVPLPTLRPKRSAPTISTPLPRQKANRDRCHHGVNSES